MVQNRRRKTTTLIVILEENVGWLPVTMTMAKNVLAYEIENTSKDPDQSPAAREMPSICSQNGWSSGARFVDENLPAAWEDTSLIYWPTFLPAGGKAQSQESCVGLPRFLPFLSEAAFLQWYG